ncbi:MAG: barstar family protein [Lachnospiraceae bacterium]
MRQFILDAKYMTNREMSHKYIAKQLSFPTYYGHNLDALYDMLTDICELTTIILKHSELLEEQLGSSYSKLFIEVLKDSAMENNFLIFEIQ